VNSSFTIVTLRFERLEIFTRYIEFSRSHGLPSIVVDGSKMAFTHDLPKNIDYTHMPEKGFMERLRYAMKKVTTPFVILQADDDFLCTENLQKSANFLENNPDYSAVTGRVLVFNELFTKSVTKFSEYRFAENAFPLESNLASVRIERHLEHYMFTIYSMQRSAVWREFCEFVSPSLEPFEDYSLTRPSMFELCQSLHCVASGKVMYLDEPWLIREYLPNSSGSSQRGETQNNRFEFNLTQSFDVFLAAFAKILHQTGIESKDPIRKALVEGFHHFTKRQKKSLSYTTFKTIGDEEKITNVFPNAIGSFGAIFKFIEKHKAAINDCYYATGAIHPAYWYDFNWKQDIARSYQKNAFQLPNYVLYGAGIHTQMLFEAVGVVGNLVGIVDKDSEIWGDELQQIKCYAPSDILSLSSNIIISSQQYEEEIELELKGLFGNKVRIIKLYGIAR